MQDENRKDPDALLAAIGKENKGKLTIFLGAAAGVGKTYAMLKVARKRLREGTDVVIGWVETHGRAETEALIDGIPQVSPDEIAYRGKKFREMNLDTILERKPQLVLVDELAHTNVPGSRHIRRFQDAEEILAAGIDVFTTLNIQHIESLNDVIAQITGVTVRETVPDSILEDAEIQLIDIPPEELLQRLREGKVYIPEQAQAALQKFFRPGNISALRELTMRYAAQRVESQVETYMQVHAIPGPWPTSEKVMVAIGPGPFSRQLVRIARRAASGLKGSWIAVYVETPQVTGTSESVKARLADNLRLAEELGAETVVLSGNNVSEELLRFARKRNVTQIIIGKPLRSRLQELLHGNVVNDIIRHSQGLSVNVIPTSVKPGQQKRIERVKERKFSPMPYFEGLITVVVTAVILHVFGSPLGLVNVAMIFLLPVLWSAFRWGIGPSMFTAAIDVLIFDFFFVPPVLRVSVADLRYVITFAIFLLVALLTGTLSGRIQQQVKTLRRREDEVSTLYALSREMAAAADIKSVLDSAIRKISEIVDGKIVILLPGDSGGLVIQAQAGVEGNLTLDSSELAVATWSFQYSQTAGKGTETLSGSSWRFLPLRTLDETSGVLGVQLINPEEELQLTQSGTLEAVASLTAMAIIRINLTEQSREALLAVESERLRSVLFNSLSHDFRTPLASIIGAVTSLLESGKNFTETAKDELLQNIKQSAMLLNRFVGNLLDMAKLESSKLQPRYEWCDIQDMIGVAVRRVGEQIKNRPLRIDVDANLPLLQADSILVEQVLVNLLDNALKYSRSDTEIKVTAKRNEGRVEISVSNQGLSIPQEDIDKVFDKFYRLQSPGLVSGTGLGLAICKGIIEAHGGNIWATNTGEGVEITLSLPLSDEIPAGAPAIRVDTDE